VLGLAVFYQYVLSAALNQQQTQYVSVFSTELFARYLQIKFLPIKNYPTVTKTSSFEVYPRYVKRIFETHLPLINDLLVLNSLISALEHQTVCSTLESPDCGPLVTSETELYDSSRLVKLLQQFAVEHLITYGQFTARQFASEVTIVTTDYEALYEFKHGDYQRFLQLSGQNVCSPLSFTCQVRTFPVFIQLFDDDFVSLIALIMLGDQSFVSIPANGVISQLTLSLYLMTQCQLKLRHSLTSLAETLDYIEEVQRKMPLIATLDHLTLKLASRKIMTHLSQNN